MIYILTTYSSGMDEMAERMLHEIRRLEALGPGFKKELDKMTISLFSHGYYLRRELNAYHKNEEL